MSLFKVCSCWSVQCSDLLENYDSSSLLCYRFGINVNEKDYVIVSSKSGQLSIYYPNCHINSDGYFQGFKPTDLLLEIKLDNPILCLIAGKFSGISKTENKNQIAILHPYNLIIYDISMLDGVAEHGKQSSLQILTDHKFNRNAFSMCKGSFGRVKGREFICVTHMDGTLTFYEQDGINYECFLPGPKTLPSQLYYISRTDSFVRVNYYCELECFSYQDLSQSSVNKSDVNPNWSLCLGEFVLDICPVQVTTNKTSIMILGEHNLINISDEGRCQFIIKLDYSPICFHSFVVGWYWEPNARLITAVVSECSSLLIYNETNLIWAAQLEDIPVAIQRSNLNNLPGGIVTLGNKGLLHIGCLGSEPFVFKVPPLDLQKMNFVKAHNDLLALENDIKQGIDLSDMKMINALSEEYLELDFSIMQKVEKCDFKNICDSLKDPKKCNVDDEDDDDVLMCNGRMKFTTKIHLEQIQIYFKTADGIKCSKPIITINNVPANNSDLIEMSFYLSENVHICTNEVEAVVSFIYKQSIARILTKRAFLPLSLLYKKCSAQKESVIKLTFSTNLKNSNDYKIGSIYSEICGEEDNDVQALGLELKHKKEMVTIVAAKNSNRFRIQSDSLEAIPAVLEVMMNYINRLSSSENLSDNLSHKTSSSKSRKNRNKNVQRKSKPLLLSTPITTFPVKEIIERIENHYEIKENIKEQTALMDALWIQFKLFQRSLQTKQKNQKVDGLMMLIERNYDDLINEGDKLLNLRNEERTVKNNLSCAVALMSQLISCLDLEDRINDLIKSILVYPIEDWTEKTWEETLDPALNMLNNYGPLCRNKSSNDLIDVSRLTEHNSSNIITFKFDRFKKRLISLLDRICRLAPSSTKQLQQIFQDYDNQMASSHNESNVDFKEVDSFTKENTNNENNNRLETLPDDEEENELIEDDDNSKEKREVKRLSNEIPPTEIMMMERIWKV